MRTDTLAIIPARYASTRLPGKPLLDMQGIPMICRVVAQARKAVARVVVATDDERIREVVVSHGCEVVMTSNTCRSGTDRCAEALTHCHRGEPVVLNLQGDEPFIAPETIEILLTPFDNIDNIPDIATSAAPFSATTSYAELADPNRPKVLCNKHGEALYFSRSVVPFLRNVEPNKWAAHHRYYKHIGIYAFRAEALSRLAALPPSPLEMAENLEQLRWLEAGYRIRVVETARYSPGIDTPDDFQAALDLLSHGSGHR